MIKEKGGIICDLLLRDDCTYYICGDANMADFVYNAVVEVLRENANMSRVKATNLLKRMRGEDCWQYDLWGYAATWMTTATQSPRGVWQSERQIEL
jgi:sulfite reductase alpha subunit-like flavoprotein